MDDVPEINSQWVHKNGNEYKVILIANLESTREEYPITIVYQGKNGKIWSRPLNRWYESMKAI